MAVCLVELAARQEDLAYLEATRTQFADIQGPQFSPRPSPAWLTEIKVREVCGSRLGSNIVCDMFLGV